MAPSELSQVVAFRKMPSSDLCLQQLSQDITRGWGDSRDGSSGGQHSICSASGTCLQFNLNISAFY